MNANEWTQELKARNQSLRDFNFDGQDLTGSDFYQSDCSGSSFNGANLSCSNMSKGTYVSASFRCTVMNGATLSGSNFSYADFREADLEGATDYGVNWEHAKLDECVLPEGVVYEDFLTVSIPNMLQDSPTKMKKLVTERTWDKGMLNVAFPDGVPIEWSSVARRTNILVDGGQLRRNVLASILIDRGLLER